MIHPHPRTVEFKAGERNVFFHILTACNLTCSHCYINPTQHGRRPVDRNTLLNWLDVFYAVGKTNNLVLLGGEPTLHKNLPEAIEYASRLGYASITVDTNGYCHHDILEKVAPHQAVFSFSIDGPTSAVNDAQRGSGSFDTCMANLKIAIGKGFDTSVIYTASRNNIRQLSKMPGLLADLGVKRFFIQVIGLRGKAAEQRHPLQLTHEQWLQAVLPAAADASQLGITTVFPKVYLDREESFSCAGNVAENFFIFPNGRVYRCPLCEDLPLHSMELVDGRLCERPRLTERELFALNIPEGCVMNKLLQPDNIEYDSAGLPKHRISCCLLKNRIAPIDASL